MFILTEVLDLIPDETIEIDEATLTEIFEKLQILIDLLFNINNWLETLVIGLIASLIVYLFYLALRNFI